MRKNDFLRRIQDDGALPSRQAAEQWAVEVAAALLRLLGEAEMRRHFVSQLPGFLKSRLLQEPPHPLAMDREAFLQHVASRLDTHVPGAERAVRAVCGALKAAVSPGQIADLERHLPRDLAALLEG
jgi:uncharacterized protein (DUF2267 family)